jgi:hypothetical protein
VYMGRVYMGRVYMGRVYMGPAIYRSPAGKKQQVIATCLE